MDLWWSGENASARDERHDERHAIAKRKARIEEGGGGDCRPPVKQAKGRAASAARGVPVRSELDPGIS